MWDDGFFTHGCKGVTTGATNTRTFLTERTIGIVVDRSYRMDINFYCSHHHWGVGVRLVFYKQIRVFSRVVFDVTRQLEEIVEPFSPFRTY